MNWIKWFLPAMFLSSKKPKYSCNLNILLYYTNKVRKYRPTWQEITMVILFLIIMANGLYNY